MGKQTTDTCPGCSSHCPLDHVRCKYGLRYIKKLQSKQEAAAGSMNDRHKHKWEKHVHQGSALWHLLVCAGRAKRALRKKRITEAQALSALSPNEQDQLIALLGQIAAAIDEENEA